MPSVSLEELQQGYLDGDLSREEYLRLLENLRANPTAIEPTDEQAGFWDTLFQSTQQLIATGGAGIRVLGEAFDNEALQNYGDEVVRNREAQIAKYGKPMQIEDIEGVGDAAEWLFTSAIPQVIPSIIASVPLAIGGAVAGKAALGTAVAARVGGALGAFLPSSFLGAGEIDREMKRRAGEGFQDPAAALGGGAIIGALDTAALAFGLRGVIPQITKNTPLQKETVRALTKELVDKGVEINVATRGVAQGILAAIAEGTTEASQEVVNDLVAESSTGITQDEQEMSSALTNSFFLGLVGGAPIGYFAGNRAAKTQRDNIETEKEAQRLRQEAKEETAQFLIDENVANLNIDDLRKFATRYKGTNLDLTKSGPEIVEQIREQEEAQRATSKLKRRAVEMGLPELAKFDLENLELARIEEELTPMEIINAVRGIDPEFDVTGPGSVRRAAERLASFNVSTAFINTGKSKLLFNPYTFDKYKEILKTQSKEELAVEASTLLPNKYLTIDEARNTPTEVLAKDLAENQYWIQQAQENMNYKEKQTPAPIEVTEGQDYKVKTETINIDDPKRGEALGFTVAMKDEDGNRTGDIVKFEKKEVRDDNDNIIDYEYVSEYGETFSEFQTNYPMQMETKQDVDELGREQYEIISYDVYKGKYPQFQEGPFKKIYSTVMNLFSPYAPLGDRAFLLDRERISNQRAINKAAQMLAYAYEEAANAAVLNGQIENRAMADEMVLDFLKKAYTRKKGDDNVSLILQGEITKLETELQTTTNEVRKAALQRNIADLKKDLADGLRVDVVALKDLPENLQGVAVQMRTLIDTLSERVLSEMPDSILDKPDPVTKETKKDIIKAQLGAYVTQSYKLFEPTLGWNPSRTFFGKRSKEQQAAFNTAVEYVLNNKQSFPTVVDRKSAEDKVNDIIKQSLREDDVPIELQSADGRRTKDKFSKVSPISQFLKPRDNIPQEFKALFGEFKNPAEILATTVNRLTSYVENYKFYSKLLEVNNEPGERLFTEFRTKDYNTPVPLEDSPIDGMYTTPAVAEALQLVKQDKSSLKKAYDAMVLLPKGIVQSFKTIFSPMAQARNFLTANMFYLGNGHINLYKDFPAAMKVLRSELFSSGFDSMGRETSARIKSENLYQEMLRLGVINTNSRLGEILQNFEEGASGGYRSINEFMSFLTSQNGGWAGKPVSLAKKIGRQPAKLYTAADDFYKIAAFLSEKRKLERAYDNTDIGKEGLIDFGKQIGRTLTNQDYDKMITEIAAYKVRNTIPNYDYIGSFVNMLRQTPFAPFVAFPTEIYRTSYNMADLALKEIRSGNHQMKVQGYRRLFGLGSMTFGLSSIMVALGKALTGADDEDIEDIRRMGPEWLRRSQIIPVEKKEDGGYEYIDGSHFFVYDTVSSIPLSVIRALKEGQNLDQGIPETIRESMVDGATAIVEPYISLSIAPELFVEMFQNRKADSGAPIALTEDSFGEQAKQYLNYAFQKAQPGFIQQVSNLLNAGTFDEHSFSKFGTKQDFDGAFLSLVGVKVNTVDPNKSIPFKITEAKKRLANAEKIFERLALQSGPVYAQDLVNAYVRAQEAYFDVQRELALDIKAARNLGVNRSILAENIRRLPSKALKNNILRYTFVPYTPPKTSLRKYNLATKKMREEGAEVSIERYYPFSTIKQIEAFYKRARLNLFFNFITPDFTDLEPRE